MKDIIKYFIKLLADLISYLKTNNLLMPVKVKFPIEYYKKIKKMKKNTAD